LEINEGDERASKEPDRPPPQTKRQKTKNQEKKSKKNAKTLEVMCLVQTNLKGCGRGGGSVPYFSQRKKGTRESRATQGAHRSKKTAFQKHVKERGKDLQQGIGDWKGLRRRKREIKKARNRAPPCREVNLRIREN